MANLLMDQPTRADVFPEALIDFALGTWTCSVHRTVMKLDSGADCPECRAEDHPPPYTPHPIMDSLVG